MRAQLIAGLSFLVLASPAHADPDGVRWALLGPSGCLADRVLEPPGITPALTGPAVSAVPDAGQTPCTLATPSPVLTSLAFFARFTGAEEAAIWADAGKNPLVGVGLTHGLASGTIDLTDVTTQAWLQLLVQDGVLTADRASAILTP